MIPVKLLTSVETVEPGIFQQANTWVETNTPILTAIAVFVLVVLIGVAVWNRPKRARKSDYR